MSNSFERILVALDASPHDQHLLHLIQKMISRGGVRKVYCVHIVPDFNIPSSTVAEFNKLFAPEVPLDERIRRDLQLQIDSSLGTQSATEISLDVLEGSRLKTLLHWVDVKKIDLLVVGQKKLSSGSGITARKVASSAPCSVIFVPTDAALPLQKILVPIDFSENSARALRKALHWADKATEKAEVLALHVLDLIPAGYHLNQAEYDSFNRMLHDTALQNWADFTNKHDIPTDQIHWEIRQEGSGKIAQELMHYASETEADAIFIGAQGHSLIQRFFFGSVTEKILSQDSGKIVFVVR